MQGALHVLPASELARAAAEWVYRELERAVIDRGRFCIALSGGSTPRAMHEALACLPSAPWLSVRIFFGDERAVPPEHPDSNYRMARESLLEPLGIPAERVHRMRAEEADRERAAREYEALLPDVLDLVVLGVGEDGHTASLFPGDAAVRESVRRVLPVIGPKPPPERLTLTPVPILGARKRLVLATGAGKAEAVARALEGAWDPLATPAQLGRDGTWFLDPGAASKLVTPR